MNSAQIKSSGFKFNANHITWIVFGALLGVLLPHTAWAFSRFENNTTGGAISSYVAAFAFEAMIALLVHKLSKHIENTPRKYRKDKSGRFAYRYLNEYGFGLLIAWAVSTLANLSHAVEFNQGMSIIQKWNMGEWIFTIAFGGILPTVSFLFARVLSNVVDEDDEPEQNERTARTNGEQVKKETERIVEVGKKEQVLAYLNEHPEMDGKVTEVSRLLQVAKGYVSQTMKEWRELQDQAQPQGAD